jgi:16S rRNA (cytosine967-C5)-methyltransferase
LPGVRARAAKRAAPRELALQTLLAGGDQRALERALRDHELSPKDRALLTQLVYGTLKLQRSLDWSLATVLKRPFAKLTEALHWTLRMGAFQLLYLQRVPAHSAVDESVKLARRHGHSGTAALANAVLRKIASLRPQPPRPTPESDARAFADYVSLPDWLAMHFIERFGFEQALRAAEGCNRMPRRALRVNPHLAVASDVAATLERAGVEVAPSRYGIEGCLVLKSIPPSAAQTLQKMIGSGKVTMQSEESQLAAALLAPQAGEVVLDVCAGRGVKTGGLASQRPARVVAVDDDAAKLALLQQDMVRLQEERVEAIRADATQPYTIDGDRGVDAILVDAPCSGIGTIGRRADLRWAKQPTDPERLARTQDAILCQAARHAKPGARLLYVTCSTDAREDEQVVAGFLAVHEGWRSEPISVPAPERTLVQLGDAVLTVPGIEGADGFFFAMLRRTEKVGHHVV